MAPERFSDWIVPFRVIGPSKESDDRIVNGERLSRPINPLRNRWLRGPVWDVITTGWSHEPGRRCRLSAMHHVFLTSSQEEVRNVKLGDQDAQQRKPHGN